MPTGYLQNIGSAILGKLKNITNLFNQAMYNFIGTKFTHYDPNGQTYVDKGYNLNSTVFSIVDQASTKLSSVPCFLKKIEDKKTKSQLDQILQTKRRLSPGEFARKRILESKAYSQSEIKEPLDVPNYYQTWEAFDALWETFMLLNGNAYWYNMAPSDGPNKGQPLQCFLLPSQYMEIVMKPESKTIALESPIDYYMMIMGNTYIQFPADTIIHTKYPNPNYDLNGSQLYGQSKLRAGLQDLNINNSATEQNIKSIQNGGVYGFVHGTDAKEPLTAEQAQALKQSLIEMERDNTLLSRYKGSSVPVGFTKLSLNTDELKPFEFTKDSANQLCNVYAWPAGLLGVNGEPKYDNMDIAWRMAISNRIQPDLRILEEAKNKYFYPLFKGYENVVKVYDVSELPEMQADMEKMTTWLKEAMDRGVITPEEYRIALKYPETGQSYMKTHYIKQGYEQLEDMGMGLDNSTDENL